MKVPYIESITMKDYEEKVIEKIVKVPYLKPIELMEKSIQDKLDQEVQTDFDSLKIAKIPYIQTV